MNAFMTAKTWQRTQEANLIQRNQVFTTKINAEYFQLACRIKLLQEIKAILEIMLFSYRDEFSRRPGINFVAFPLTLRQLGQ